MERATKDQFVRTSLRHEHVHRYELVARLARGVVVDCACGIGYGSGLIASQKAVESYLGIDPSEEAISYARANYEGGFVGFEQGTLESNSCAPSSVDIFLMLETLEHTKDPAAALTSVRRCLKSNGLLIGSVPSAEYESLCESIYGPNPFHLQRFTTENLARLLGEHFECVRLFSMEFVLGSLLRSVDHGSAESSEILLPATNVAPGILGSIVFFAGSGDAIAQATGKLGASRKFFTSVPKAILDRDEMEPIRSAMKSMDSMIRDRDSVIADQAGRLEERWRVMQGMDVSIRDRDLVISDQARALEQQELLVKSLQSLINDRDVVIADQARKLEARTTGVHAIKAFASAVGSALRDRLGRLGGRDL